MVVVTDATVPLSILDLAVVGRGEGPTDAFAHSVALAQLAERLGYHRVWYAEHHNMESIASSATSVLIAHVAAHTTTIRLGSGGIMLPNHSPLVIAEQFGTLAELHPGRIDLGLGRAPGTDQATMRALRHDPYAAQRFPEDVRELQAFLAGESAVPGVHATPGAGTDVPLYILGSSLFGAQLAATLGLPFGFASHFAPGHLHEAVAIYRDRFEPSAQLAEPWVIAGVNVIAADTDEDAQRQRLEVSRRRVARFLQAPRELTDAEADEVLASPQGRQIADMTRYTAAGCAEQVRDVLSRFALDAAADELITVHSSPTATERLRSAEILADVWGLARA